MYEDGDSLQYIDRVGAESYLSVRSYPAALSKKVGCVLQDVQLQKTNHFTGGNPAPSPRSVNTLSSSVL